MATYVNEEEVVYQVEGTKEEQEAIMEHNKRAKLLRAERREEERFEKPTFVEKMAKGIKKLLGLQKKKQIEQNQQNTR